MHKHRNRSKNAGGPSGGGTGGRGAPIEPPPESMDKLRKLNGEDTNRSQDDPKSG